MHSRRVFVSKKPNKARWRSKNARLILVQLLGSNQHTELELVKVFEARLDSDPLALIRYQARFFQLQAFCRNEREREFRETHPNSNLVTLVIRENMRPEGIHDQLIEKLNACIAEREQGRP